MKILNQVYIILCGFIFVGDVCFGSEVVKQVEIDSVTPGCLYTGDSERIKCELEFFCKESQNKYSISARLLERNKVIFEFSNIDKHYNDIIQLNLKDSTFFHGYYFVDGTKFLHVCLKNNKSCDIFSIKYEEKAKKLLNMKPCNIVLGYDTVTFKYQESEKEVNVDIYNSKNIEAIKYALLSCSENIIIDLQQDSLNSNTLKVAEYTYRNAFIWNGWRPEIVPFCPGMPVKCFVNTLQAMQITINLNEDKEYFSTYQMKKYGFRTLIAGLLVGGAYWLKTKIMDS